MSTITFQCVACQQVLKVSADKAGRKAKCVKCGTVLTIPGGTGGSLNGGSSTATSASKPASVTKTSKREEEASSPRSKRRFENDDDDRPRKRRREEDYDEDEDEERPRRRREEDEEEERPSRRGRREEEDEDEERPRRRREEEDEDNDERGRRRSGWRAVWPRVRVGLLLVLIALGGLLVALGLELISRGITLVCFFSDRLPLEGLRVAGIFSQIAIGLLLPTLITAIVGYVFWLFVTNKNGALAFAIATLAVAGVNLILFVIFRFIPIFDRGNLGPGLSFFGFRGNYSFGVSLLLVVGIKLLEGAIWILASLYLVGVAKTTKDRSLAGPARFLVIWSGAATAYTTILPAVIMIIVRNSTGLSRGFAIVIQLLDMVGIGLLAVLFIFFLLAVKNARANLES